MRPVPPDRVVYTIPSDVLVREIRRRRNRLRVKRSRCEIAIAAIDNRLMLEGVLPPPSVGRAPAIASTLKRALAFVLHDRVLSPAEAASLLPAVGYRSTLPNLTKMVQVALLDGTMFQRVARGRYTAIAETDRSCREPQDAFRAERPERRFRAVVE
ncbi:MAG: hypothetical protein IT432_12140 [Phycisphaerales bacterium]|nr:hypothetical protein [Phycisphaerales bacterium]